MKTPVYRFEHKIIGRSARRSAVGAASYRTGKSAVAAMAYRSGDALHDERSGRGYSYANKFGILGADILLPLNAPAWMADREKLWNAVEHSEKRRDSQLAREVVITLPHGLGHDKLRDMARDFVRDEFVSKGMVADLAFHLYGNPVRRGDKNLEERLAEWKARDLPFIERGEAATHEAQAHILIDRDRRGEIRAYRLSQPHVHVMLTMRDIDPEAEHGFGKKNREWNEHSNATAWRQKWAETGAAALAEAGMTVEAERYRVGYMTLPDQRKAALARGDILWAEELDREPQTKLGPLASKIEADGRPSHAGDDLRAITARNGDLNSLKVEIAKAVASMSDITVERLRRGEGDKVEIPAEVLAQQHKREADEYQKAERIKAQLAAFEARKQQEAEEAQRCTKERQAAMEAADRAGEIASASGRYAEALGATYTIRDPYGSLANAAMTEYGMFNAQQQTLKDEIAKEPDAEKRRVIELRMQIEAAEYMAITSTRLASIGRVVTGHETDQTRLDEERAKGYATHANQLREERGKLQKDMADREAAKVRAIEGAGQIPADEDLMAERAVLRGGQGQHTRADVQQAKATLAENEADERTKERREGMTPAKRKELEALRKEGRAIDAQEQSRQAQRGQNRGGRGR